jgi:hypothetical protein
MGQHRAGDVPVPARVAADFVLIQAALVLRGLEALLDLPAHPGDAHQVGHDGLWWGVGEEVGDLCWFADAAAGQSPPPADRGGVLVVELGHRGQLKRRPVVEPWALGAVAARDRLPRLVRCLGEQMIDARAEDLLGDLGTAST